MRNIIWRLAGIGLCCAALATPALAFLQNSIQDYCEISWKILTVTEMELKDRIALAKSHTGTQQELDAALQSLDAQYERLKNQVYSTYGTTVQAFLRYGAAHQSGINSYLEQNSSVKDALEDLNKRIQSLRQEMESVMSAKRKRGSDK
jgi:chromosome segregation ATPase